MGRIVARYLPPDPPFEKMLFVDLVPRPPQTRPIRLLPSTSANWGALPGPPGISSKENMRRLGAWLGQRDSSLVERASAPFFFQGHLAPLFGGVKLFMEYDRQYG